MRYLGSKIMSPILQKKIISVNGVKNKVSKRTRRKTLSAFYIKTSTHLVIMCVLMSSKHLFYMGHLGLKLGNQGQKQKHLVNKQEDWLKLSHNMYHDNFYMYASFLYALSEVNNQITSAKVETLCEHSIGHIFNLIIIEFSQNVNHIVF